MNHFNVSGLRIATAILASSVAFFAAPAFAAADLDSADESSRVHHSDRLSHPHLGEIDGTDAAYIAAMEARLGLWE